MWEVGLASLIGGIFLWLADVIFNDIHSVTNRIAQFLGNHLDGTLDSTAMEGIAFALLIALGWGLCFVFRPQSRPAAFARGSSVMAVLVGMNTGAQAVAAAAASELHLENDAIVTYDTPRALGPFGLGTAITGKLAAEFRTVPVPGGVTLPCAEQVEAGGTTFCGVDAGIAARDLGLTDLPKGRSLVWVTQAPE
jgi:hypothetical protein